METPRPSIGQSIGSYRITALLGSGGMGAVYRATDVRLEREVALKVLRPETLGMEPQAVERFRREARALAKLNHPHIATVYDAGEENGLDYIVMECVEGETLAARLRQGPIGVQEATRVVMETAEALDEAHARGIIHRDIKPANVMLTQRGGAKVLDFGVAKLLAAADATQTALPSQGAVGTPMYMSPEQATGKAVDARTDLWSLGVLYYEALTRQAPFRRESGLATLRAIAEEKPRPLRALRPEIPEDVEQIVTRALEKDAALRYQTAAQMAADARDVLARMSGSGIAAAQSAEQKRRSWIAGVAAGAALALALAIAAGWLGYRRIAERRWAREEAIPQIENLVNDRLPLAAFRLLQRAQKDLPEDKGLTNLAAENTTKISATSEPGGALVEIQDYLAPQSEWMRLGTTPLAGVAIPQGYFRWRVTAPGQKPVVTAPETEATMDFPIAEELKAPARMVYVPGQNWSEYESFIGWLGPYALPSYYMDRYEVTNAEYQRFVDAGGYEKTAYWPAEFQEHGQKRSRTEAMGRFRDSTGRPGPSTWAGGHFPAGQDNFPVSGVSWYEAMAYAAYAGEALPTIGQWLETANVDEAEYIVALSNVKSNGPSAAGAYQGIGPYGNYDMAGNVREWIANSVDGDNLLILGGSWRTPNYLFTNPEALTPFDRSDTNGFRCVRNLGPMPQAATAPIHKIGRDFAAYKPVNDDVFRAYTLLYAYEKTPLNAKDEGAVKETDDWREEKVSFDAAYHGERMSAYLFLPKRVKPPYQAVLFFPSARVLFLPHDSSVLGDVNYFDYIIQSGRAVIYPVYEDTYERRSTHQLPSADNTIDLPVEWYKDAARSLDYLDTRPDIDKERIAYLGVSMGAANGVIFATLLQERLKAAVFLDGGYFLQQPTPGIDQADFAPRLKLPVLMVNGRYDYTFPPATAQDPLMAMLGTPPANKEHVVLDTPHDVSEDRGRLVPAVLGWLDKYLGRVQ
ncbi:MAG TPA: protein kinase [Acidobacteriaceae bacterium]|nr:protein kinase [Acidobacteriaceae bacterium]